MKLYLTLAFILMVNTSTTSARLVGGEPPTLRACLFHDQLYAIVQWTDICDITLVDGIFGMRHGSQEDNHYQLTKKEAAELLGGTINRVDIPHNPDCFTSEPYQQ